MYQFSPYNTELMSDHIWMLRRWQIASYPSAIIGGGAIRDIFFRTPPNDIDIFYNIKTPNRTGFSELVKMGIISKTPDNLQSLYADLFQLDTSSPGVYDEVYLDTFTVKKGKYARNRIHSIQTIMKEGRVYQFIGLDMDPVAYAHKHFDTGICMCYCDGRKFHYSNEFLRDATNRTITICGNMTKSEYNYSQRVHIPKLQRKFPDFKVVDMVKDRYN